MKKLTISMASYEKILGWGYYGFLLLILPQLIVSVLSVFAVYPSDYQVNVIYFAINFIAVMAIFHQFLKASVYKACSKKRSCVITAGKGLLLYFALSFVVVLLILSIYPDYANLNNEYIGTMAQENVLLMLFGTVLLVPITEEIVFRGLIFANLFNHNKFLAYALSALAFSAIHVVGYLEEMDMIHALLSILQYLPAGIALGWAYEKTDTIVTPVLMHTIINLIGIFAVR